MAAAIPRGCGRPHAPILRYIGERYHERRLSRVFAARTARSIFTPGSGHMLRFGDCGRTLLGNCEMEVGCKDPDAQSLTKLQSLPSGLPISQALEVSLILALEYRRSFISCVHRMLRSRYVDLHGNTMTQQRRCEAGRIHKLTPELP